MQQFSLWWPMFDCWVESHVSQVTGHLSRNIPPKVPSLHMSIGSLRMVVPQLNLHTLTLLQD
jgi:hypothetical protein